LLSNLLYLKLPSQGLKEAVASVRAAGRKVTVASPRLLKADEERLVHFYLRLRADALLVRSAGLLHQLVSMGGPGGSNVC
jgi:collagenase-like PrtC family protease